MTHQLSHPLSDPYHWLHEADTSTSGVKWADGEEMKAAVQQFALGAEQVAAPILNKDASQSAARSTVHHHHYSYWPCFPLWYQPASVVLLQDRGASHEGNGAALFLLSLAATVVTGVGLYLTGSSIKKYQDSSYHLESAQQMHEKLSLYQGEEEEKATVEQGKAIAVLQGRLSRRIANDSLVDLALRVSLIASAAAVLLGTLLLFVNTPPLIAPVFVVAGLISGLATGGGMLFKWGLSSVSQRNLLEAAQLRHAAHAFTRIS